MPEPLPLTDEEIAEIERKRPPLYGLVGDRLIATIRERTEWWRLQRDALFDNTAKTTAYIREWEIARHERDAARLERDREAEAARRLREACENARPVLEEEHNANPETGGCPLCELLVVLADSPEAPHAS